MVKAEQKLMLEIKAAELEGRIQNEKEIQQLRNKLYALRNVLKTCGEFDVRILGPRIAELMSAIEKSEFKFETSKVMIPKWFYPKEKDYYEMATVHRDSHKFEIKAKPGENNHIMSNELIHNLFTQYDAGIDYEEVEYSEDSGSYNKCFYRPIPAENSLTEASPLYAASDAKKAKGIITDYSYVYDFVDYLIETRLISENNTISDAEYDMHLTIFIAKRKVELIKAAESIKTIY